MLHSFLKAQRKKNLQVFYIKQVQYNIDTEINIGNTKKENYSYHLWMSIQNSLINFWQAESNTTVKK